MVISDIPGILLVRKGYITFYNTETKCPNWVFWHLTGEHTDGDVPRLNKYFEDEDVPLPRIAKRHEVGYDECWRIDS